MFKLPSSNRQTNGVTVKTLLSGATYRIIDSTNRCYTIEIIISKLDDFSLLVREQDGGHYAVGYSKDFKIWHLIEDGSLDQLRKLNKKREVKKGLELNPLCRKIKSKMIALSKENLKTLSAKK